MVGPAHVLREQRRTDMWRRHGATATDRLDLVSFSVPCHPTLGEVPAVNGSSLTWPQPLLPCRLGERRAQLLHSIPRATRRHWPSARERGQPIPAITTTPVTLLACRVHHRHARPARSVHVNAYDSDQDTVMEQIIPHRVVAAPRLLVLASVPVAGLLTTYRSPRLRHRCPEVDP